MPKPEFLVFKAHEKFDKNGYLIDEPTLRYLNKYLNSLIDWIKKFK